MNRWKSIFKNMHLDICHKYWGTNLYFESYLFKESADPVHKTGVNDWFTNQIHQDPSNTTH